MADHRFGGRFGWLHFTDLHQGVSNQGWLWPNVREDLYRDLASIHEQCGPWNAVFFTGDLTQRGARDEFERLEETLAGLWGKLGALGSLPVLLAVPGNHDLVRPKKPSSAHRVLSEWHKHKDIHDELWDKTSEYYQAAAEVFQPYQDWWQKRCAALPGEATGWLLTQGFLPGEFSLSIPCGSRRIGVVGLNSAFLQLAGGNFHGRLHLHTRQFHEACGGDGPAWAASHDLCFLLTHHPPDWLHEDSRDHLRAEIDPPGRFVAHLYGHMHVQAQYAGADGGAGMRRYWQAPSLFGLESSGKRFKRAHGYTAGCIDFAAERADLRLWPRSAVKTQAGPWRFGPDSTLVTLADGGTKPERLSVRPLPLAAARDPEPAPPPTSPSSLQRPGLPYDQAWHVVYQEEEQAAIENLQARAPVVVCAPLHFGKTWFVQRVSARIKALEPELTVVYLDLNLANRASLETLLHSMGEQIAQAVGRGDSFHWPAQGTSQHKLTRVLEREIKPHVGQLLLILDLPDDFWDFDERDGFFRVLRSLAGQGELQRWSWLTLFLALSMAPSLYLKSVTQSPLNVPEIVLGELLPGQIAELAGRHGLAWGEAEIRALMAAVGGHPLMVRQVLYEAAKHGRSLEQVLAGTGLEFHLSRLHALLERDRELCDSLRTLMQGGTIDSLHRRRLEAAGMIRRDRGKDLLRFAVYERLLERL